MFDRISGVYDRMNRVMTAGMDQKWRSRATDLTGLAPGDRALDLCCGTGDLTLLLADRVGSRGEVVGADFSRPMLELAGDKAGRAGTEQVRFEWADALDLPYRDDSFEALTIAFGARNLADLDRGLAEMFRVLAPGGRLVILEITRPARQPLKSFYGVWFDRVVPVLGRLAGDEAAYGYLPSSVRSFPDPESLAEKMASAGFDRIGWSLMAGGIIALHHGQKPGG